MWTLFFLRSNRCTIGVMVGTGDGAQLDAQRLDAGWVEAERLEAE
jgi:hypothetical protein